MIFVIHIWISELIIPDNREIQNSDVLGLKRTTQGNFLDLVTQGTKALELAEVAEKLRIREMNFQNYIGRFLYQFWPINDNECKSSSEEISFVVLSKGNIKVTRPRPQLLQILWLHYFRFRKLSDVEFWRISVDILTWRARYIHFSSLMVVKSFRPEATKMFDSLWCRGPPGHLCKIFYWKLPFPHSIPTFIHMYLSKLQNVFVQMTKCIWQSLVTGHLC